MAAATKRKTNKAGAKKSTGGTVFLPTERYIPEDVVCEFSDAFLITHAEDYFVLSFLQSEHPLAASEEELKAIGAVQQACIARLIVSPKQLRRILEALKDNLERYENNFGADGVANA